MNLRRILTKRQMEMFTLLAQGYSMRQIGDKLKVSRATVSKVLRKVYEKLEAEDAVNALREALLSGMLRVEDLRREK